MVGDEDELDEREWPDESDADDLVDTEPCPFCGKPVYDRADICPHCGNFITREDAPIRKPGWFVAGVIVCLIIVLLVWIL